MISRATHARTTVLFSFMTKASSIVPPLPRIGKNLRKSGNIPRLTIAVKLIANSNFAELAIAAFLTLGDNVR
ncbi:MAG TPA: hypothetical protein PKA59_04680 [Chakrabartia sp.]|nr:hypothetical protein [Chakrabartia sp.]